MVQLKVMKKHSLWIWALIIIVVGLFSLLFFKTSFTISQITSWQNLAHLLPFSAPLPEKDPDRVNILLLGVRGIDDPGEGKLLADAIVLCSIKKSTKQVALISLPRDIFIKPLGFAKGEKINFFYALGEEKKWAGGGLEYMKRVISEITNLYIDYAISANFQAFEKVVDELGGLTIYLDQPFEEYLQWVQEGEEESQYWVKKEITQPIFNSSTSTSTSTPTSTPREVWAFYLPAGQNILDGEAALYYVRSRYSTNDFDRMRRQQNVLMAIKDKALSLGVLANPVKIYNLLDILGNNVLTDMDLDDLKELVNLAQSFDPSKIKTKIFDTSPQGLLYYTFIDEIYVLLPAGGNFERIQEVCKNIFD